MGRYCRVCGRNCANERIGGKWKRANVCDSCRKLPTEEQQRVLLTDDLLGYLEQSNISATNIARLHPIEEMAMAPVAMLAALVREIARVKPHGKKRWTILRNQYPNLLARAVQAGLMEPFEVHAEDESLATERKSRIAGETIDEGDVEDGAEIPF